MKAQQQIINYQVTTSMGEFLLMWSGFRYLHDDIIMDFASFKWILTFSKQPGDGFNKPMIDFVDFDF